MKNKTLVRLFSLLLALTMLIPLSLQLIGAEGTESSTEVLESGTGTETETGTGSETEPPVLTPEDEKPFLEPIEFKDDYLYIAYKNTTTYSIVHSKKAMNLVKAKVVEIVQSIKKWTAADHKAAIDPETDHLLGLRAGADINHITDGSYLTPNEIVIGQVGTIGRDDLEALAAENNIGSADFMIYTNDDGTIWIIGGSNTATSVAVDYAFHRLFDVDEAKRCISVRKGIRYIYRYKSTELKPIEIVDRGENEFEFITNPLTMEDTFCSLTYNAVGGWRVQNKFSLSKEFEGIGASQQLAMMLGEDTDPGKQTLTYEDLEDAIKITAPDGSYVIVRTATFAMEFYTKSGILTQTVNKMLYHWEATGKEYSDLAFSLVEDEPIYGTGQRFDGANQYGKILTLYSTDVWDDAKQSHVTIPLFINPRGNGLFINRNEYMVADIGKTTKSSMAVNITSGMFDYYVLTTESIADAIGTYCDISGSNQMPEDWSYGMLVCRAYPDFANKAKVYEMIAKMEQHGLEWTGLILQGWSTYSEDSHEDLKEVCDYVHSLGKKVIVYITVGAFPGEEEMNEAVMEAEADRKLTATNYFMTYKSSKNKSHGIKVSDVETIYDKKIPDFGSAILLDGFLENSELQDNNSMAARYYLDLTNPEAVEWFINEYWETLVYDIGVDGAKIDAGYYIPDAAGTLSFYDPSMKTAGTHHWYPTLFNAMVDSVVTSKPGSGMTFVRGAGIGAQRASYVWAGEQTRYYARNYNRLERQLKNMLASGLSGMAFTSFDIAGSKTNVDGKGNVMAMENEGKLYIRGAQVAAFSVSMQTNGDKVRSIYEFAEYVDPETGEATYAYVTEIFKLYSKLHEDLIPYLSEYSEIACETGVPVARHLVLHFPTDTTAQTKDDEYMLGDAFLVAPEIALKETRSVYLPEGKWTDLVSGTTYEVGPEGKTISRYKVSLAQIPVFFNENVTSETALEARATVEAFLAAASEIELP